MMCEHPTSPALVFIRKNEDGSDGPCGCRSGCANDRGTYFVGTYCEKRWNEKCDRCKQFKRECICLPLGSTCRDCENFDCCKLAVAREGDERVCITSPVLFKRGTRPYYLFSERCDGPFYMGWHMYTVVIWDRWPEDYHKPNSLWLRSHEAVIEIAASLGMTLPACKRYGCPVPLAFANTFPAGLIIDATGPYPSDWDKSTARHAPIEFQSYAAAGDYPDARDPSLPVGWSNQSATEIF